MATSTGLVGVVDRNVLPVLPFGSMTLYTADQAVFFCSYPPTHSGVTLVLEKLHVITPHHLNRLNTLLSPCLWNLWS